MKLSIKLLFIILCSSMIIAGCSTSQNVSIDQNPKSEIIDTEGTNLPEIIVDEDKLDQIPEPDIAAKDLDQAEEKLEDVIEDELGENINIDNIDELAQDIPEEVLPTEINLDIQFYAQAPDGNRELPWKEACEEASIILGAYYLKGQDLSKDEFKSEVNNLVALQLDMFDDYIDTSMAQTAELYEAYYGVGTTEIIENPSIEDLKRELALGHPIVAPFAGKELGNSNFTGGGPRYHVLVMRGYDDTYFYTNDVGTKRGENFPYSYEVIMNALHDLVRVGEGDINTGEKRVLVLKN